MQKNLLVLFIPSVCHPLSKANFAQHQRREDSLEETHSPYRHLMYIDTANTAYVLAVVTATAVTAILVLLCLLLLLMLLLLLLFLYFCFCGYCC
jgi:hypothetical protein